MSTSDILAYNSLTTETFDYKKVTINNNGGKNVNVFNKDTKTALNITTPQMRSYGISDYEGNQRYELTLQFPEAGTNAKADIFLDVMKKFEEGIKADAITNCKEWFGKQKMSSDVVDALWTPMLKYPKTEGEIDYSRSPTLRVKTPFYPDNQRWDFEIYNVENERLFPDPDSQLTPLDYIKTGTHAGLLIRCGGLWFANGKFGVTWRLIQAKIKPRTTISGVCQIPLDDDDVATMDTGAVDGNSVDDVVDSTQVESDDEDVVEEPVKPVKKKVVRKKAAE